jgi:hypothetical protein
MYFSILFYLQMVCRRQQGLQLNVDRALGSVEARNTEKQRLQQGIMFVFNKM